MPPAAQFDFSAAVEEPYNSVAEVGGIEVEALQGAGPNSVLTRIRMLPRDHMREEFACHRLAPHSQAKMTLDDSRFAYFARGNEKCLADSFDSVDEIEENSNEARLLKSIAMKATVAPDHLEYDLGEPFNPDDPYFLDETEAKYLDVLDRHLEETDPESTSFAEMESGPDDPHPKKTMANIDQIMEHLLDNSCCECSAGLTSQPLKSALRPSRWTYTQDKTGVSEPLLAKNRSVQFKEVDIKEFKMTLGFHPSATSGPPVMLDWETGPSTCLMDDLHSYEKGRQPRRNRRQLKLSLQQRHNILVKERGFTFEEVKGAWQEALEIRKQRKETLERGLALMKWDELWESTCRKFNRLVDGSA